MLRSAEWGRMPLHWYFTSALPRALLAGLTLAALGVALERRVHHITICVLLYIAAYSLLPHKEVRHAQSTPCYSSIARFTGQSFGCMAQAIPEICSKHVWIVLRRWHAGMLACREQ